MPNKIITYLKEVNLEIKKISWPTRNETVRYTMLVIGVSVVIALFLGGVDSLFRSLLNKIILK